MVSIFSSTTKYSYIPYLLNVHLLNLLYKNQNKIYTFEKGSHEPRQNYTITGFLDNKIDYEICTQKQCE